MHRCMSQQSAITNCNRPYLRSVYGLSPPTERQRTIFMREQFSAVREKQVACTQNSLQLSKNSILWGYFVVEFLESSQYHHDTRVCHDHLSDFIFLCFISLTRVNLRGVAVRNGAVRGPFGLPI